MPLTLESPNAAPRPSRGPEPLRRKRVQPIPATNAGRRKLLNILLVFATVVLLVDALIGEKGFMERVRATREYQQQASRLDAIRRENQALQGLIVRLNTDRSAIEEIARQDLGLIKRGEVLFIVRDVKGQPSRPDETRPAQQR